MLVFVRDDLTQVGWTEDGEADIASRFYLVVRADNGAQVAHDYSRTASGGNSRVMAMSDLDDLRDRVQRHLDSGGALDRDHWGEIDPAYGSEAYQALDAGGYFWAHEVLREVDAGEAVDRAMEDEARSIAGGY